ncbi:unnamed protein product [Callosobruchus maculatus]|uniref:Tubulin--tyrosine ligase-like protein 12 SET-like domain-containing protein n=1 Tax=Callosobruchus maculatus TaxID=64391 RepID=A0A653CIU5_CALMS|nr:unnamed protein product [Callosobruchus maculatus]
MATSDQYIMDEVGSAVAHSDSPNCRMVPFFYMNDEITYSLLFPIESIEEEDFLTRDYAEDFEDTSLTPDLPGPAYFLQGHVEESMPVVSEKVTTKKDVYKVYTEYEMVRQYLTDNRFTLVDTEQDADILWYTQHFKDFEGLSKNSPEKFVNQFPFEYVITVKDLLCITCRRNQDSMQWLPTSYNLITEIANFVAYYQHRQKGDLENYWIVKPYNLARGLDYSYN